MIEDMHANELVTERDRIKVMDQPSPSLDRPILCYGHDWSPFTIEGKFIPYRGGKKVGRFCVKNAGGTFTSAPDVWKDVEEYEYLD